jgi:drug/metabolite transporter (DMT)-like permease
MPILLALLAAVSYGVSDFAAGVGSRRIGAGPVAAAVQFLSLVTVAIALAVFSGVGPAWPAMGWGAASGIGNALGTYALYRGFTVGRMSVVATLSAVITAAGPIIVGFALGEQLSALAITGIGIGVPAIALVSWQGKSAGGARGGVAEGIASGAGFALLFIALDQAGTQSGAWPLVAGQGVALLALLPLALGTAHLPRAYRANMLPVVVGGVLGGLSNVLFLAATGQGQLAIVAVLTALYPAFTILLARLILKETWTRLQVCGLGLAAVAVALITLG